MIEKRETGVSLAYYKSLKKTLKVFKPRIFWVKTKDIIKFLSKLLPPSIFPICQWALNFLMRFRKKHIILKLFSSLPICRYL